MIKLFKWFLLPVMFTGGMLNYYAISKDLTKKDLLSISLILKDLPHIQPANDSHYAEKLNFKAQIILILQVQHLILKNTPSVKNISPNQNLEHLYLIHKDSTLGHSIVLEKTLKSLGFQTRHISLFEPTADNDAIATYAISEVLTQDGWLILDSRNTWIGLTRNYCPISIQQLQQAPFEIDWLYPFPKNSIFNIDQKSHFVYRNTETFL